MIPIFGVKGIDDINESDLQKLKDEQVRENRFIEYKRDMYGRTDSEVEEMLADITAFANAQGGYLFIGISEASNENPIPQDIQGIDNADAEAQRIRNRCRDCVDEYIQGLQVKAVPLNNSKGVVIASIPNSPRKPHMVTVRSKNRFYIRRDEGKSLMSVEEIRDTVLKVEDYMRKLEGFLEKRKRDILEEIFQADIGKSPCWMIISACPIFRQEDRLDVATSEEIKYLMRTGLQLKSPLSDKVKYNVQSGTPIITLNGLRSEELTDYSSRGKGQYLEVWNEGYVEFGFSLEEFSKSKLAERGYHHKDSIMKTYLMPASIVSDLIISFCYFADNVSRIMQINEPIVFKLMFLNCHLITLQYTGESLVFWSKSELIIKPLKFYLMQNPSLIAKNLITKLFRAFSRLEPKYMDRNGDPKSLFDEGGNYKP